MTISHRAAEGSIKAVGLKPRHIPAWPDIPEWHLRALCGETDPDLWFPEKGHRDAVRQAKLVCKVCPVLATCRTWALDTEEPWGLWGGMTAWERRKLRRAS